MANFDYAIGGRGTLCIRGDSRRFLPGAFRSLLSRMESDLLRRSLRGVQFAWYLPNLVNFDDPFDIAGAAISYARRHPDFAASYVVAPQDGLVALLLDVLGRNLPAYDIRFLSDPMDVTARLRVREPEIPQRWQELARERAAAA